MPNEKIVELGAALNSDIANWQNVLAERNWSSIVMTNDDLVELLQIISGSNSDDLLQTVIEKKQSLLSREEQFIAVARACPQCVEFILFYCGGLELSSESLMVSALKIADDIDLSERVLFDHERLKTIKQIANVLWVITLFPGMKMLREILFTYRKLELFNHEAALLSLCHVLRKTKNHELIQEILFGSYAGVDLITNPLQIISLVVAMPRYAMQILFTHKKLKLFHEDQFKMDLLLAVSSLPELTLLDDFLKRFFIPSAFTEEMAFIEKHYKLLSEFMLCKSDEFITSVCELCAFVRKFPLLARVVLFEGNKISLLSSNADCNALCEAVGDTESAAVRAYYAGMRKTKMYQERFFVSLANKENEVTIQPREARDPRDVQEAKRRKEVSVVIDGEEQNYQMSISH